MPVQGIPADASPAIDSCRQSRMSGLCIYSTTHLTMTCICICSRKWHPTRRYTQIGTANDRSEAERDG